MTIEIYRNKTSDFKNVDLSPILKTLNSSEIEEEILHLKKFGLKAQIASLIYPELTADELCIWEKFLPRKYGGNSSLGIKNYNFSRIPLEILREWDRVKELGCFDLFLIRTPESPVSTDPILLGVIHGSSSRWLIARWGESLLPFNEIRDLVLNKKKNNFTDISRDPRNIVGEGTMVNNMSFLHNLWNRLRNDPSEF